MTLLQLSTTLPAPDSNAVNIADSVKVAAHHIAEGLATDPQGFFEEVIKSLIQFGLKVIAALVIYLIGAWIIRRIKKGLARSFERRKTEKTLASFISSLVSILLTILLIVLTVGALGVNTTSIAAMLGAGAMAVGLALSGTMENLAGGLIILIFKPFKAGDYISVQGYSGTVTDVSIVSTKITTTDNRVVVIPNGSISNGTVDNYNQNAIRRLDWNLAMEYGTPADECLKAIREIASKDPRILDSSTPGASDLYVALTELNEKNVTFMLRVWMKTEDYWDLMYDMNKQLYTELPERGFRFAYTKLKVESGLNES